ncbi:MAG: hypothetical protein HWD61_04810 [Parachlamydiaceae bacterium]|nr:MAG: hypothetical protein HWD61_04810 [Parachlamydiaceae bacterium]
MRFLLTSRLLKVLREIGNLSNFIFENANRDDANLADDNRKAIKITGEILSDSFVAKILKDEQFSAEEESEVNAKVEMISKKIAEIKIVQMVGIGIDEIPTSIKHLTGIRSLGLNSNNLKSLPEELKFLVSMTTLNLCGNSKLKMLPRSLAEIKSLKEF